MKLSRVLFLFITFCFLAGQVEYTYAYCEMMKRPADAAMLRNCAALHHGATGGARLIPSNRMPHMRIISKFSTDSFEHHPVISFTRGPIAGDNFARVELPAPPVSPARFIEIYQSLPDIILSTRTLRI